MARSPRVRDSFPMLTRRACLAGLLAAPAAWAQTKRGETLPAESKHFPDPTTELDVIRLTDPASSSVFSAHYNRDIARSSLWMLFTSDRAGSPQAFRLDLRNAQLRQLTDAKDLDASSLTLTPDNRSFCYCAGRSLYSCSLATLRDRELYSTPEGWERTPGISVGPDGTHAILAESKDGASRLRMISLVSGAARTVIEAPFVMSHAQARPLRAQLLYRQDASTLWMVNMDGQQNRKLKLAPGAIVNPKWSNDGRTLLYLNIPEDHTQLNAIRELSPDAAADKLVAKTSQYASFGFNHDSSVFVGASGTKASPTILILLRVTRREMTLCEHRASDALAASPRFSPDSQRIYFQSDKEGKPAIYCMHVDKLVEKTEAESK
jgi:oligogalacturonide lyase